MKRERRLLRIARQMGCAKHGARLHCQVCAVRAPLPEPISSGLDTLLDAIVARLGKDAVRRVCRRVPMPDSDVCPRCGSRRTCPDCTVAHGRRLFRELDLVPDEQAQLQSLLALCREKDHG
jgi:hypothetical protein